MNCVILSNNRVFMLLLFYHFVAAFTQTNEEYEHPCLRPCVDHSKPMECHYKFHIEVYYILSLACFNCPINVADCYRPDCIAADGMSKSVLVANRRLPGPSIQVCKNDIVIVDVENDANPQTTSIHWHGIAQHNYQFMDGVPKITQCPIEPLTTFRYRFPVPEPGTYLWHSHSGHQKDDGLFGALVIRQEKDQNTYKYDHDLPEHVIVINDWYNVSATEEMAKAVFYRLVPEVQSILVNGRGRYANITITGHTHQTPVSEFHVEQGKRYRFRLIGSGTECSIQVSIEGHRLLIIATDGRPVVPTPVDAVNLYSGERYDFILTANNTVANYWMKFRGLEICSNNTASTYAVAILRYTGALLENPRETPSYDFTRAKGFVLNPVSADNKTMIGTVVTLNSTLLNDVTVLKVPDVKLTLRYDYRVLNDTIYNRPIYTHNMSSDLFHTRHPLPLINYIFNSMPPSPLLSEYNLVPQSQLCDAVSLKNQGKNCTVDFCECTHVIKLPLNAVVQVLLVDDGVFPSGNGNHPIHLHGHTFRVVAMGRFSSRFNRTQRAANNEVARLEKLIQENKLPLKLNRAVYKDTINVPNAGYTVIRFYTDNPGFWFLHCHIDFHMELGMGLVFQAGHQKRFPKPPRNFPTCGNYLPRRYN